MDSKRRGNSTNKKILKEWTISSAHLESTFKNHFKEFHPFCCMYGKAK